MPSTHTQSARVYLPWCNEYRWIRVNRPSNEDAAISAALAAYRSDHPDFTPPQGSYPVVAAWGEIRLTRYGKEMQRKAEEADLLRSFHELSYTRRSDECLCPLCGTPHEFNDRDTPLVCRECGTEFFPRIIVAAP